MHCNKSQTPSESQQQTKDQITGKLGERYWKHLKSQAEGSIHYNITYSLMALHSFTFHFQVPSVLHIDDEPTWWEFVHLMNVESISAVMSTTKFQQQETGTFFFSGTGLSDSVGEYHQYHSQYHFSNALQQYICVMLLLLFCVTPNTVLHSWLVLVKV